MNFGQRLKRYLIGVSIGLIFVIAVFNERWGVMKTWLPGQRVLDRLEATYSGNEDLALCQLKCYQLDSLDIQNAIKKGEVNFKKSRPRAIPITYVVENNSYDFVFNANDSLSFLAEIIPWGTNTCDCD